MAYTPGDTLVHPRHGVATVLGIATRDVGSGHTTFLELAFASPKLTILVPLDAVDEVGIRPLPTKRQAAAILALLARPSDVSEVWTERSASTRARMESTKLTEASMVIRDLTRHARRSGKALSRSESVVLQTCLDRVSSELSLVLDLSQDDTRALILEAEQSAKVAAP